MFSDSMMMEGGGREAAFSIAHSVRLDGAEDYFTASVASAPTSQQKCTLSFWVKRVAPQFDLVFTQATGTTDAQICGCWFDTAFHWTWGNGSDSFGQLVTAAVFRDFSAWMHVVLRFDSTDSIADKRMRLWINGVEITVFSQRTNPPQNMTASFLTAAGGSLEIGRASGGLTSGMFRGYLAEFVVIDGQALEASAFSETAAITGSWRPKAITGLDFGANGFHLDFANAEALGADSSGNGHSLTPISLDAADLYTDTPTNNYCTFNPLDTHPSQPLGNGNLTLPPNTINQSYLSGGTMAFDPTDQRGFYFEATMVEIAAYSTIGFCRAEIDLTTLDAYPYLAEGFWGLIPSIAAGSTWEVFSPHVAGEFTFADGDVMGFFVREGKWWASCNGIWFSSGSPDSDASPLTTGLAGSMKPFGTCKVGRYDWNFGQKPFVHTPPVGARTLCSRQLPQPIIQTPAKRFSALTYSGTGAARTLSGLDFQPDLVWIKSRSAATSHALYDSLRGAGVRLESNSANGEVGNDDGLTAFTADGFTLGALDQVNAAGQSYVAWCWKAGSEAVANSDGTIASMVKTSLASGFGMVSYTGNNAAGATVGHGLGRKPSFIIAKSRSADATDWTCYHSAMGADHAIWLNLTTSSDFDSTTWNDTEPNAATFTLGTSATTNPATPMIAYCWAEVPGFSKFGKYTGALEATSPFIHCGFRPKWLLIKEYDGTANWNISDTARSPGNGVLFNLNANGGDGESAVTGPVDLTATGFKLRTGEPFWNAQGSLYLYAAFAEYPLGGEKSTAGTAR